MTATNNLRESRKALRYSQQALADLVGVSQSAISLYEKGAHPPYRVAMDLADVLHTDVEDLFPRNEVAA